MRWKQTKKFGERGVKFPTALHMQSFRLHLLVRIFGPDNSDRKCSNEIWQLKFVS